MTIVNYIFLGIAIGLVVISILDYFESQNRAKKITLIKDELYKDNQFLENEKQNLEQFPSGVKISAYHFLINDLIEDKTINLDKIKSLNQGLHQILSVDHQQVPNFKINYPEDLSIKLTKRQGFFIGQYLLESAHNAIEHSTADFYIHLITFKKRSVSIICHDNGQGYDSIEVAKGSGIKLMHASAQSLNGDLKISSIPSVGTKITLEFNI